MTGSSSVVTAATADGGDQSASALSIIVVNYRSWAPLERCLASLDPRTQQVIVIDNASGDGRLEQFAASHPAVTFVSSEENGGFAGGCNLGAGLATAPWLLFLNPDALDPDHQIARLLECADQHGADIATCRQVDEDGRAQKVFDMFPGPLTVLPPVRSLLRRLAPRRWPDARRCRSSWRTVDWVSGSALLIRREAFDHLGGWSTRYFMYSEDVDLCRRAHDEGLTVGYTADATLVHGHGGASRASARISAFTRAETTISRHLYVSAHLHGLRAGVAHGLLVLSRTAPALALGVLGTVLPVGRLVGRRGVAARLLRFYARGLLRGHWRASDPPATTGKLS